MDHGALISEMEKLEHMPSQARLRLAKKRRMSQIRQWALREKSGENSVNSRKRSESKVKFPSSVTLLEASSRNDVNEVYNMLKKGVSPDSANEDGLTALHQCCIDDNEEMLELLLENGADVNAQDTELWTPLHAAATCGHLHLVKYLIDRLADLLAVNADGNMPYDLCEDDITLSYIENEMAKRNITQAMIDDRRRATELRMLEDLKNHGNLEKRNAQNVTPLHISAANGYSVVMEYLLDNDVSLDVVDVDLWQPIHAAACWGHLEAVELLATNGANINALTKNGEKPTELTEDEDIKQYLIHLHEQRLQNDSGGHIVRRNKSVSSRSQSIRRSSLREKMRTTKKDAQEEKMYLIKNYETPWSSYAKSNDKAHDVENYSSREDVNNMEFDISSSNILDNVAKNIQDNEGLRTSINGISSPVNIHVSVTINTNQQQSSVSATSGTLSDLKKQRSLNRVQQQQQQQQQQLSNKNSPLKDLQPPPPLPLKANNNHNNSNLNLVSNHLGKDVPDAKSPTSKRFSDSEEVVGTERSSSSFLSSCCMIS